MVDNDGVIATIEPGVGTQFVEPGRLRQDVEVGRANEGSTVKGDDFIVVIDSHVFLRECVSRSMESVFSLPVVTYSTVSEFTRQLVKASARLVILSLTDSTHEDSANNCKVLSDLLPEVPIIVLAHKDDADLARTVISHGAKGYIPLTMGFEFVVAVTRFVLAGGAYVPVDCLMAPHRPNPQSGPQVSPLSGDITRRELAVVRAIQKGKSNKIIAYELNMCENTVKVHVRNIMKKWKAKNRTDIAIKAQNWLGAGAERAEAA